MSNEMKTSKEEAFNNAYAVLDSAVNKFEDLRQRLGVEADKAKDGLGNIDGEELATPEDRMELLFLLMELTRLSRPPKFENQLESMVEGLEGEHSIKLRLKATYLREYAEVLGHMANGNTFDDSYTEVFDSDDATVPEYLS